MYAIHNVEILDDPANLTICVCILAASAKSYLGTVCMFGKMLSVVLFLRQSPLLGVIYIILCISKYATHFVLNMFSAKLLHVCSYAVHSR